MICRLSRENYGITVVIRNWALVRERDLASLEALAEVDGGAAENLAAIDDYVIRNSGGKEDFKFVLAAPCLEANTAYYTNLLQGTCVLYRASEGPGNLIGGTPATRVDLVKLRPCGTPAEAAAAALRIRPDGFNGDGKLQIYSRLIVVADMKIVLQAPPQYRKYYSVANIRTGKGISAAYGVLFPAPRFTGMAALIRVALDHDAKPTIIAEVDGAYLESVRLAVPVEGDAGAAGDGNNGGGDGGDDDEEGGGGGSGGAPALRTRAARHVARAGAAAASSSSAAAAPSSASDIGAPARGASKGGKRRAAAAASSASAAADMVDGGSTVSSPPPSVPKSMGSVSLLMAVGNANGARVPLSVSAPAAASAAASAAAVLPPAAAASSSAAQDDATTVIATGTGAGSSYSVARRDSSKGHSKKRRRDSME